MKLNLASSNRKEQPKTEGESIRHRVSSSRSLGYVFFLVLSLILWYVQSLDQEVTRSIQIPLAIDSLNLPESERSEIPSHIEVSVSDKLINHILHRLTSIPPIPLTLHTPKQASPYLRLRRTELQELIQGRLSSTAKILSMSPDEVDISFHKRIGKLVPLVLSQRPNIDQGYMDQEVRLSPDSIMVYANAEVMGSIMSIAVGEFPKEKIKDSQTFSLPLLYPAGVMGKERTATVHVQVEELTEQTIEHLTIHTRNVPDDVRMILLPSTASLRLTIPRKLNESLSEHLSLYVDYNDIRDNAEVGTDSSVQHKLPLRLENVSNHKIYNYTIEPSHIQYILEKQ